MFYSCSLICVQLHLHMTYISNILRVPRTSLISCSGTEIAISEVINSEFIFKVEVLLNLPPEQGPGRVQQAARKHTLKNKKQTASNGLFGPIL